MAKIEQIPSDMNYKQLCYEYAGRELRNDPYSVALGKELEDRRRERVGQSTASKEVYTREDKRHRTVHSS